jgi:hypothetical protein
MKPRGYFLPDRITILKIILLDSHTIIRIQQQDKNYLGTTGASKMKRMYGFLGSEIFLGTMIA